MKYKLKKNFKFFKKNFIINNINKNIKNFKSNILTRFPPEGNNVLHIGHLKSIILNLDISRIYNGFCNLRIDDSNPKTNKIYYIKNIKTSINWLLKLEKKKFKKISYTSNYFHKLYQYSEILIKKFINIKNLKILRNMREGFYKEKKKTLKLKLINFKKKKIYVYRILYKKHYKTKYNWYIYPIYDYAHSLSDKIEKISYSLCTLEFEENKYIYNWYLNILFKKLNPIQIEFSRLKIKYNIISKKKLLLIKKLKLIKDINDCRLLTINSLKLQGYNQKTLILFSKNLSINKNNKYINKNILKNYLKININNESVNRELLKNPIVLIIDNYKKNNIKKIEVFKNKKKKNVLYLEKEILVEKNLFFKKQLNNKYKLINFNKILKLNYSYFIICKKIKKNKLNKIKSVHCEYIKNKPKKNSYEIINWINKKNKIKLITKIYDEIFKKIKYKKNIKKLINIKSIKLEINYCENIDNSIFKKNYLNFKNLYYKIKKNTKLNKITISKIN